MSVLLLTGTCASGKTTIGKLLVSHYGYKHIDGDVILQSVKRQRGNGVGWNEIHQDILSHSLPFVDQSEIVITHIIYPKILPLYKSFFAQKKIPMTLVVLMPSKEMTYERNITRESWQTPKKYVDEIYAELNVEEFAQYFLDTSNQTAEESVKLIRERIK